MSNPECTECGGPTEYLQYVIRIGGSDPLHAFKCGQCGKKCYFLSGPTDGTAVTLANN